MEPVYKPVIGAALALFTVMRWDISTRGEENVPTSGGAVIATNHIGYLDFVFVGYAARKRGRLVRFMAKKEAFDHKISGPLMRGMKHISVDRFGRANQAIEDSVAMLQKGEVVGMFPESTISRSFVPAEAKTGAARMAMLAGVPLIPGAVWGTQRILTKDRPKNFQPKVAIDVALEKPIPYRESEDPEVVTERLMVVIRRLVDELSRSYKQSPAGPDDTWWLPAHLGGTAPTVEESLAMSERDRVARARKRAAEA